MAGLERVIVGYRKGDREIHRLEDEYGQRAVFVSYCASCGWPTHFVKSGQDAYMTRDPVVLCTECFARHKDQVIAEL